ncbi:MAG: hypothetical protein IAG13_25120 [Deltaproteobacteria bacterium]|nr:hypothetical protein [Nannocystaceae bacterium]
MLVSAAMVFAAGCFDTYDGHDLTPAPADLTYSSDALRYGAQAGFESCGWSLEYLERFIELYVAGSEDGDIEVPVEYYFVDSATIGREEVCGGGYRACARYGVVYADSPVHTHEVVHAIRHLQHGGTSPGADLLEEGIAQLHYPVAIGWDEDFRALDLPSILDAPIKAELYDSAANLLGVVAHERSFAVVEQLVDCSWTAAKAGEIEGLVEELVDVDLVGLDAMVSAYPRCSPAARMRMLVECAAEPVSWNEGPWATTPRVIHAIGSMACDDPRVLGPLDGRLWTFATIDVPTDGTYRLDVESEEGQRLEMTSCDAICGEDIDLLWDAGRREEELELSAGRAVVRLSRVLGDEREVSFRLYGPLL